MKNNKTIQLSDLHPHEKNPRGITQDELTKLKDSINGFEKMLKIRPIVVDTNNIILAGNQRYKALMALGYVEIPAEWVTVADQLTEAEKKEFIVKDNVQSGFFAWEIFEDEFWKDTDFEEWIGEESPVKEIEGTEQSETPEPPADPITVMGDLYELVSVESGITHRVHCGDSTDSDVVRKTMGGVNCELCFSSPPYSDMRDYDGDKDLSINYLKKIFPSSLGKISIYAINLGLQFKDNEVVQYWNEWIEEAQSCGLKFLSWNIWDKTQPGSMAHATRMFGVSHEWIFIFGKDSKKLNRTIPNQTEKYEARHGKDWEKGIVKSFRGKSEMKKATSKTYSHKQLNTVIRQYPELGPIRSHHPATYPIGLPFKYIEAITSTGESVYDPFLGSGTTLIACEQLQRTCYGQELDEKYMDVIVNRWINYMNDNDLEYQVKRNGENVTSEFGNQIKEIV